MTPQPYFTVALKGSRTGGDRVDGERFSARGPRGIGSVDPDAVKAQQGYDTSVFGCDDICSRRDAVERRRESIVDRHADRLVSSGPPLASRDAGFGERRVRRLY